MCIVHLRDFFLWCAIINYGVLFVWFIGFMIGRDWMQRFHGRWFRLPVEKFDAIHYAAMAVYKIGILLFNLVPYIVLRIVG